MGALDGVAFPRIIKVQYLVDDEDTLQVSKFICEYRATRRQELTDLLMEHGCCDVRWIFPEETGFYQPIVVAKKQVITRTSFSSCKHQPPNAEAFGGCCFARDNVPSATLFIQSGSIQTKNRGKSRNA